MNKKITQKNDFKKSHTFNKTKSKQNIIQSAQYSQNGGANPGHKWFYNIFGFNEITTFADGNKQLNYKKHLTITTEEETINTTNPLFSLFTPKSKAKAEKHTLNCKASGVNPIFEKQYIGMFDRPSVGDLETCIANKNNEKDFANLKKQKLGDLTFEHILTTDVALLHCDPSNDGAVFQVASQFNCLEMIDQDTTPNNGVTIYYNDRTQGPACAMACPAALVYRNYFVKNGDQEGQLKVQINNLEDIGKLLENNNDALWTMQNGYVIIDDVKKLQQITTKISSVGNEIVINALRVGVHWTTSVVDNSNQKLMDHQVCQVYASALPVSITYNPIITDIDEWTDFATCILDGSYRATLCIAALIALKSKTRIKCYLTCIGGGAFGNKHEWIINAIKKALVAYKDYPIDVMLVHFNANAESYKDKPAIDTQIPQDYKQLPHIPANGVDPAPKTATQEQENIFEEFKSRLNKYKPTNLKYKDYGQIIDENYQIVDNIKTKRIEILIDTLKKFEERTPYYYELAKENMLKWCEYTKLRNPKGLEVIVEAMDWGEMALKCTKNYGSIFACLNMANSRKPGGGYEHGAAAQEENMFRRTNCHFSIDRSMLIPNEENTSYGYTAEMQALISAKNDITYLDVDHPRICIKDKETYDEKDVDLKKFGYIELNNNDVFLFYELRCAAAYLDIYRHAMFQKEEMKKRIEAQFTTLKEKGIRHAIMSAFGSGAFHNPPKKVAELYKECLMRYKNDFDVIAFPIYYAGSGENNYDVFREILLNNPSDPATNSIFIEEEANGAVAAAKTGKTSTGIHALVTPKVVTPAAAIAAITAKPLDAANKKKHKNKKDTKDKIGKDRAIKAETHEVEVKDANVKAETDEALIDKAANVDAQGNGLRQAGSKDLAQVVNATNGNVSATNGNVSATNGNVSASNGTPSPSFDISPEGSNGQGMLIGFLILCTLGIGAVSFIK